MNVKNLLPDGPIPRFLHRTPEGPTKEIVHLKRLESAISERPEEPSDYAPHEPMEKPMQHITMFGELPTKEIDEMLEDFRNRFRELESESQRIRDDYVRDTSKLIEEIKVLQEGVKFSMETMKTLRENHVKLRGSSEK